MQIITVEATLETFEFLELSLEKQLIWDSPFWFQSLCVVAFITSINNCSFFFCFEGVSQVCGFILAVSI